MPATILWAEDNRHDQLLIEAALADLPVAPQVRFADDGLHLLARLGESPPEGPPALVVLDLKMPRLGGIETLRRIRADPRWASLPVSIFSAGNQPDEIATCQSLGVVDVQQKPVDFGHFTAAVQRLVAFAGR
jgi:two-component system response regulator